MRIGLLIDTYSSLYCWQWMGQHDHEYIIYRDQNHQDSSQTTLNYHHTIIKQGIDYLIHQGVDYIVCPPIIELHFQGQYPQIAPIFQNYLTHILQHSIVGKIGFVGNPVHCESINLHRGDALSKELNSSTHQLPTLRQINNRHFNSSFPLRTNIDQHLTHRLGDHNPDHYICNTLIKQLLRPLKDANVDTVIGLDWSYYACDVSRTHHCRSIKRHRNDIFTSIFESLVSPESSGAYSVSIHHTGTLRDLKNNKKLRWLLTRGQNYEIKEINID